MILMFTVNSYNDGGKPRASGDDPKQMQDDLENE